MALPISTGETGAAESIAYETSLAVFQQARFYCICMHNQMIIGMLAHLARFRDQRYRNFVFAALQS